MDFEDGEDALISLSFKRAAGEGIIITNDKDFPSNGVTVLTPKEALERLDIFSNENNNAIPMLDLKKQYHYLAEDIDNAVLKNIADARYILGPEVKELEDKIAVYLGVKHCIGASSGTEALVLSLRALAIKLKGREYFDKTDEIITTPIYLHRNGRCYFTGRRNPVFVDIDPNTYNIEPAKIREYLIQNSKPETRNQKQVVGIIPVHLYGQPCDMDEIMKIAEEYNLFVLEDVAQAFGGTWKSKN